VPVAQMVRCAIVRAFLLCLAVSTLAAHAADDSGSGDVFISAVGTSAADVMHQGANNGLGRAGVTGGARLYISGQGFSSGAGNAVYLTAPDVDNGDACPTWWGVCVPQTLICPIVDLVHDASMFEEADGMMDLTVTSRRSASTTFLVCEIPPVPMAARLPDQSIADWSRQYQYGGNKLLKMMHVIVQADGKVAECRSKYRGCMVR